MVPQHGSAHSVITQGHVVELETAIGAGSYAAYEGVVIGAEQYYVGVRNRLVGFTVEQLAGEAAVFGTRSY
jgi:hypothetical protein